MLILIYRAQQFVRKPRQAKKTHSPYVRTAHTKKKRYYVNEKNHPWPKLTEVHGIIDYMLMFVIFIGESKETTSTITVPDNLQKEDAVVQK